MPNLPWEDANLRPNLVTLGRLKIGDKLSVLKKGATPSDPQFQNIGTGNRSLRKRFDIQKGGILGKLKQKAERKKKGEDILVDVQYLIPLTHLFTAARTLFIANQGGIQLADIKKAYNGIARLQMTHQKEGDSNRVLKVMAILRTLSPLIPRISDRSNIIALKKGSQVINLFNYKAIWPNLNNTLVQLSNLDNNSDGRTEQAIGTPPQTLLNVTQQVIQQVILETPEQFRHTHATQLPTLTQPYTRQAVGVCRQFPADWLRHPPKINGVLMGLGWNDLRKLFVELRHDEGMFFLVSQLLSQVGLEALPSFLFGHRNAANMNRGRLEFVFYYNDLYWYPNQASDRSKHVTTSQKAIELKVETRLRGNYFWSPTPVPEGMNLNQTPPFSLKATNTVALRRSGNAIAMTLKKAQVEATCR